MDVQTCIETRMSIRGFSDKPVDRSLLTEIVATASWSPSYKNSQPWEVMIVSGKKKNKLSKMLVGLLEAGETPTPDIAEPGPWPTREKARSVIS